MYINSNLDKIINNWINNKIPNYEKVENNIFVAHSNIDLNPLWIFDYKNNIYLSVQNKVKTQIIALIKSLQRELLFSDYGKYEIAEITHKYGYYLWGPSWIMFAEENDWIDIVLHEVEILNTSQIKDSLDVKFFWHNYLDCLRGFVIKQNDQIIACATLKDVGGGFVEIGVDVDTELNFSGLGSTVYSAAGRWAFDNGYIPFSSVGPWNVPSARTQIKCGMKFIGTDMTSIEQFKVPPQTLGTPNDEINIYDYYPKWGFNKKIIKRD